MSGWNKWGIRRKLFSVIILILLFNVVVLLVMGSTLFAGFYQSNKIGELKKSANQIRQAYQQNSETFYDEISLIENENTLVSVFSVGDDGSLKVLYHSRADKGEGRSSEVPRDLPPMVPSNKMEEWKKELLTRIQDLDESFDVQGFGARSGNGRMDITLATRLDANLYLFMQTPKDFIRSTADLAVIYTALLSIGILLIGSVIIYFVVARVTKPIQQIQKVAGQIAKMDFSDRCEIKGGDEIAMLGTSINHMSEELEASIEKLVEANQVLQNDLVRQQQTDRMRQQFVANVSHDFKTPLTLMISYAEAIAESAQNDHLQEYCEIIIGEGNKLSQMVGRLLNLSKLENGIDQVEKSIFCLSEAFDQVINNQRIITERQNVTAKKELDEEFIVYADYQKIEQVVTNLFENAVKYTPPGGTVVIAASRQNGKCHVSVINTGDHIAEEDLENLFESFYRADKSRTRGTQSYGLGLAIVKVVMEAHGQRYGVENIDKGVKFWFELELSDLNDEEQDPLHVLI